MGAHSLNDDIISVQPDVSPAFRLSHIGVFRFCLFLQVKPLNHKSERQSEIPSSSPEGFIPSQFNKADDEFMNACIPYRCVLFPMQGGA